VKREVRAVAASQQEAAELAARLMRLAEAISGARALGLSVDVPQPLHTACLHVAALHGKELGAAAEPSPPYAESRDPMHDVPLRRLIWQVIDPGETFTVTEVTERLRELGVTWPTNKVSNALGYWVSRQRLQRPRKGVYYCTPAEELDRKEAGTSPVRDGASASFRTDSSGAANTSKTRRQPHAAVISAS
jgi:hypothetical protein